MEEIESSDPALGQELVQIVLDPFAIKFVFDASTLVLYAQFVLKKQDDSTLLFDPSNHKGDLEPLWVLLGSKITHVVWGDHIKIELDKGTSIEVPPTPGQARGEWWGGEVSENGIHRGIFVDDF